MSTPRNAVPAWPLLAMFAASGAVVCGLIGAVVGLVLGLQTYAPTAWAAIFEVGVPATAAGVIVGALAALVVRAARHLRSGSAYHRE